MDEELLERLNSQNWDVILLELMAYAVWLCRVNRKSVPESVEPEDLVMAVIDKVYAGERKWNPDTDPDLLNYLKSVVKSHLNNQVSTGHHPESYEEADENRPDRPWHEREEELYFRQIDATVIKLMEGDSGVCLVYKGLKDGLKPESIAGEYGVDIRLVRNAQRRLRTIILRVLPSGRRNKLQTHESR